MSRSAAGAAFTVRKAGAVLGLDRTVVAQLIAAGFVLPGRGPDGGQRFTFQELRLLRTAHALKQAGLSARKITQSLEKIKAGLPADASLVGLRISAVGAQVAVRDRLGAWHADTGQRLLDFEPEAQAATVLTLTPTASASPPVTPPRDDADHWFSQGVALEGVDDAAAEDAYRRAIAIDPGHFNAGLNLGARLSESDRHGEALTFYDAMLQRATDHPLLHFNRAVVLENLGRRRDALGAYDRALELDPSFADAHYNAGQLSQELGDPRGALRHFSACRRLRIDDAR